MTTDELKKLAIDIVDGKVFGSWMLPKTSLSLIANIFMPLAVGGTERLPDDVSCIYEYLDKATPLAINGHPTFFSFRFITHAERECLVPIIERYQALKGEFLNVSDSISDNIDDGSDRQPLANQD